MVKQYHYFNQHVIVSIDGVEHFSSTKIHCDHCTTRKLRNSTTSYHHSGLAAVLLHPDHEEVFPLDFEAILKQDGAQKNDCERNAAKRLCAALHERYRDEGIVIPFPIRTVYFQPGQEKDGAAPGRQVEDTLHS